MTMTALTLVALGEAATNRCNLICAIESAAIVTVADIFAANFANVKIVWQ